MEFIKTKDLNRFKELGYSFSAFYTENNLGSTYHVAVMDRDGNEVVHTKCSYANGSGHGYAMSGAETEAVARLEEYINNLNNPEAKEELDYDFLNNLLMWDYINDYGYDTEGTFTILFDTWEQLEGTENRNTGELHPSVFARLVKLAEEGKLKPSINYMLTHFESAFTDSYAKCDHCGRIISREWEGLNYIESTCEMLCNDCVNESEEAIADLIEEAKGDFKKALPVMISEDKLINMGYVQLDEDKDFSTRYVWGEEDWNCYNIHADKCEEWCKQFGGFAKLVGVWQFDSQFQLYFPTDKIEEVRQFTGIGYKICL